ncbi:MAG: hypothetical protein J6386_19810 [Candidatus Synoicihabitans palmerolidicus]|nr:hypothetical protein [Candidatus Synoicihabitans palmerolidicus]
MWLPFSALLRHWVGVFHGVTRTVLILAAWYLFFEYRSQTIPVIIYAITILVLEKRYRSPADYRRHPYPTRPI